MKKEIKEKINKRLKDAKELKDEKERIKAYKMSAESVKNDLLKEIVKRLDILKKKDRDDFYKFIKKSGIDADTLKGLDVKSFAKNKHLHDNYLELKKFLKFNDELKDYKKDTAREVKGLKRDGSKIIKNIQQFVIAIEKKFFKKIIELKEDVKESKKQIIKKHSELDELNWKDAGHIIDEDLDLKEYKIFNLGDPEKNKDAVNKEYVDRIIQRVARIAGSPTTPVWYTRAEVDALIGAENWDRVGTVLSPHNAGDSIDMGAGTDINEFSVDGTLSGDSDDAVPTEKAVKTYVDAQVAVENLWDRVGTEIRTHNAGDDLLIDGEINAGGDINASANGSSQADPRVFGYKDLSSGEACRFQFGDEHNGLQNAYAENCTLYSYWTLVLMGGRQNHDDVFAAPAFTKYTDVGVLIDTERDITADPTVAPGSLIETAAIRGCADQTTNLLSFRDSADNKLSVFTHDGSLGLGTDTPATRLEALSTDTQLRLTHTDGIDECDFFVNSDGEIIIMPTARTIWLGDGTAGDATFGFFGNTSVMDIFHDDSEGILDISSHANIGTNCLRIKSDGEVNLIGTARVKKKIYIGANGIKAPGAKPATFVEDGLTGCWEFADAIEANQESVSGTFLIPADMDRTIPIILNIGWHANGISPGNCKWQLEYLWRSPNESVGAAAQETLTVVSTASATSEGLVLAEITGIDLPSATDAAFFWKVTRLSGDVEDTISAVTHLRGQFVEYTANKLGKSG